MSFMVLLTGFPSSTEFDPAPPPSPQPLVVAFLSLPE
jgi:hypothetical protein